jgi:hypothetical protein
LYRKGLLSKYPNELQTHLNLQSRILKNKHPLMMLL